MSKYTKHMRTQVSSGGEGADIMADRKKLCPVGQIDLAEVMNNFQIEPAEVVNIFPEGEGAVIMVGTNNFQIDPAEVVNIFPEGEGADIMAGMKK